jgi:methionine aminopeptidase
MYPDFMIEDMRAMGRIASRLLTQLEMQISSGMNLRQLEFNFEVNQ